MGKNKKTKKILEIISKEADKLAEKYHKEDELHDGYYIGGIIGLKKVLGSRLKTGIGQTERILKVISIEADRLEEKYREEGEIHEDYYIWGVRRFEKILKSKLER